MTDPNSVLDLFGMDAEYNPREINQDELARLDKTMREFGDLSGIVVNRRTNTIVSGHQRKKVMDPSWQITKQPHEDYAGTVAMGYIDTPMGRFNYREVDWDLNKEKAANLAANEGAGNWDFQRRVALLEELDAGDVDMDLTGHSPEQLELLFNWTPEDAAKLEMSLSSKKPEPPAERLPHQKLASLTGDESDEQLEELTTIKINLTIKQIQWLDVFYKYQGLNSRSDAIRYLINQYQETQDGSETEA